MNTMDISQNLSHESQPTEKDEIEFAGKCSIHRSADLAFYCADCPAKSQLKCNSCILLCMKQGHKNAQEIPDTVEGIKAKLDELLASYTEYDKSLTSLSGTLDAKMSEFNNINDENKRRIKNTFNKFQEVFEEKMKASIREAEATDQKHLQSLDDMNQIVEEEIVHLVELTKGLTNLYSKICKENEKASKDKDLQELASRFQKIVAETKVKDMPIQLEQYVPDDTDLLENIKELVDVQQREETLKLEFKF
mmetsp:Transcript_31272/g.36116  ORF Transcript_31272/g.36116 Transcript_31272/m.36116 type:complete len:250 (-) Transcript_31272:213-962(-)